VVMRLPELHVDWYERIGYWFSYQFRFLKQVNVWPWGSLFKNETLPARTLKKLPSKAADADW